MKVPYLDLRVKNLAHKNALINRFSQILDHGQIINGPEQIEFERTIANEIGTSYALGLGSGSSALFLALKACNIGNGDEVITTPYTWIITANAILATGATPVFIDVQDDFNINPGEVIKNITQKRN